MEVPNIHHLVNTCKLYNKNYAENAESNLHFTESKCYCKNGLCFNLPNFIYQILQHEGGGRRGGGLTAPNEASICLTKFLMYEFLHCVLQIIHIMY